jgi:hypothetical protein
MLGGSRRNREADVVKANSGSRLGHGVALAAILIVLPAVFAAATFGMFRILPPLTTGRRQEFVIDLSTQLVVGALITGVLAYLVWSCSRAGCSMGLNRAVSRRAGRRDNLRIPALAQQLIDDCHQIKADRRHRGCRHHCCRQEGSQHAVAIIR